MKSQVIKKRWKLPLATCLISIQLLTLSSLAFAKVGNGGVIGGGGGDPAEERVNEIRSDILNWLNFGGAKELVLPDEISYTKYVSEMSDILQPKKVVVAFTEEEVNVGGVSKTCKGFFAEQDDTPNVLCNISRFKQASGPEQYKLIHHEFAGLKNLEKNDGAASDYSLSSQLTDFLAQQTVLRLAVKRVREANECDFNLPSFLEEKVLDVIYFCTEVTKPGRSIMVHQGGAIGSVTEGAVLFVEQTVTKSVGAFGFATLCPSNTICGLEEVKRADKVKFLKKAPNFWPISAYKTAAGDYYISPINNPHEYSAPMLAFSTKTKSLQIGDDEDYNHAQFSNCRIVELKEALEIQKRFIEDRGGKICTEGMKKKR